MGGYCLAIIDADRIHEYVFSPHRLRLIRGGSNIERDLNEVEMLRCLPRPTEGNVDWSDPREPRILDSPSLGANSPCGWEAISAGGGTALIEFADRTAAENYCREVEQKFHERTGVASATWVVEDWDGSFGSTLGKAQAALALRKEGRTELVFDGTSPYWKFCEDCGRRPATVVYKDPEERTRLCCLACDLRRQAPERGEYLEEISRTAGVKLGDLRDLSALGEQSRPENYLAMVYVDVDRLGKYLHQYGAESKQSFRLLSGKVRHAILRGAVEGCAAICAHASELMVPPFEVLLIGGDDALLMVAADRVFTFLDRFAERYHESLAGVPHEERLSFSAGVVWAHQQFPVAQFRARAEELVRSAKSRSGDAVDWLVASEATVESLSVLRGRAKSARLESTAKPYSLDEFRKLWGTAKKWKEAGVPATKVKALYPMAYQSEELSVFEYWTLFGRLRPEHQLLFNDVFPGGMWVGQGLRQTKAADLVELWDFVQAEEK
jgi:hypothetical protein